MFSYHDITATYVNERSVRRCTVINITGSGIIALDCTYLGNVKRLLLKGTIIEYLDYKYLRCVLELNIADTRIYIIEA